MTQFSRFLMAIVFFIGGVSSHASTDQSEGAVMDQVVGELFEKNDIVFWADTHNVAGHKENFIRVFEHIQKKGSIDAIAIEFTDIHVGQLFQQYLADEKAEPDTFLESGYFSRLHRRFSSMNNKSMDELMRALRKTHLVTEGKTKVCAVDVYGINGAESSEAARKKQDLLLGLPLDLQKYIESSQQMRLSEIAKTPLTWDRDARMAMNIADCARNSARTLVLIGTNHVLRIPETEDRRSTLQMTELLIPEKSVSAAISIQPFHDPRDPGNGADETFFVSDHPFSDLQAFSAEGIPEAIAQKMRLHQRKFPLAENDFTQLFDYFVFGPRVEMIR